MTAQWSGVNPNESSSGWNFNSVKVESILLNNDSLIFTSTELFKRVITFLRYPKSLSDSLLLEYNFLIANKADCNDV